METNEDIKIIQKKCEEVIRRGEIVGHLDLIGSYGDVSEETINQFKEKYLESLADLRDFLNNKKIEAINK